MRGAISEDILIEFGKITASFILMPIAWIMAVAFFTIIVWATMGEDYDRS